MRGVEYLADCDGEAVARVNLASDGASSGERGCLSNNRNLLLNITFL